MQSAAGVTDSNLDDALHVLQGHAANRYTDMSSSSSSSQLNKPSAATCSVSSSCAAAAAAAVNSPSVCAAPAATARCLCLCVWYDCLRVIYNQLRYERVAFVLSLWVGNIHHLWQVVLVFICQVTNAYLL